MKREPNFTEAGKVIVKLREQNNEANFDMAKKIKFESSYLSMICTGRRKMSEGVIKAILKHYDVSKEDELILYKALIPEDMQERFLKVKPDITIMEMVYIVRGDDEE